MRYYETLYIINPNFEQERIDHILDDVSREVDKLKFSTINHRVWGKKRLAFSIDKHKYGTYILLQFEAQESSHLADLKQFMKLNKLIMRSQIVRIDKKPEVIEEQKTVAEENEIDNTPTVAEDGPSMDQSANRDELKEEVIPDSEPAPESAEDQELEQKAEEE